MQEFRVRIDFYQGGMQVIVIEKLCMGKLIPQLFIESGFEIKNAAFIRDRMDMGNSPFVAGLGDQHATVVAVEGLAEDIKEEITLPDKADAKAFTVFGIGFTAGFAAAFKIKNPVKI